MGQMAYEFGMRGVLLAEEECDMEIAATGWLL
jgi:hypothetical protein